MGIDILISILLIGAICTFYTAIVSICVYTLINMINYAHLFQIWAIGTPRPSLIRYRNMPKNGRSLHLVIS